MTFSSKVEGRVVAAGAVKVPVELNPFPVISLQHNALSPRVCHALGMHYLALDALPSFRSPLPAEDKVEWLRSYFGFALAEEKETTKLLKSGQKGLFDLKESLAEIVLLVLEKNRGKPTVVHLKDPKNGGTFTLLFVSCIKIDLTAHTAIVDACALPLTGPLLSSRPVDFAIRRLLTDIQKGTFMGFDVITQAPEVKWWQAYLPTAAERCRAWKHSESCEYISEGVPRSLEMDQDPICSCGRGKALGGFAKVKEWAAFSPYVTRVALGMPFSTSLLGGTASILKGCLNEKKGELKTDAKDGNAEDQCADCGGHGKPTLLMCSRCKGAKYCSAACHKADWKNHKVVCGK